MKRILAVLLLLCMLFMTASCSLSDVTSKVSDVYGNVKENVVKVFNKTKDATISLYGTAKDGAVYVFDAVSDWTVDKYEIVSEKVTELIGDGKEFIDGLFDVNEIQVSGIEDYDPYATAKSELFVPYYISSLLADKGYSVYNGGVYYKDHVYGGIIFTKNEVYIEEDGSNIYSCGFIQLVSQNYTDLRIDDNIVDSGLIAVSAKTDSESSKAFVVQEYAQLSSFSGIIDDTYFSYNQTGNYVVEISFAPNKEENYNKSIELYNFDTDKQIISVEDANSELEKLYAENNDAYNSGVDANNALADYIANEGVEVSSLVVLDNSFIDTICEKCRDGYSSLTTYIKKLLSKVNIGDTPLVSLDSEGNTHLFGSELAADAERMADGLVCAVGSGLGTSSAVLGTVATVAFCAANSVSVVPVIVITTGACSVVYNVSNMLAGMQDVYYGAKGDVSEAENPVLLLFKQMIPNESVATLVYHIWGISNTVICSLMKTVARSIKLAVTKGLGFFQTVGSVARASLTQLAKMAMTGVAAGVVTKYVSKVVEKITGSAALSKVVGFGSAVVAGYFTYKGLDSFDKACDISGLYPKEAVLGADGLLHYYDKNGNEYKVGKQLNANTTFTNGNTTTTTDDQGRVKTVESEVELRDGKRLTIKNSLADIGQGDEHIGDDRGHILGDQLGGSNEIENMMPQNSSLNRGDYVKLENQLAEAARSGSEVSVKIDLLYEGNSHRPSSINYQYTIDGKTSSQVFLNP